MSRSRRNGALALLGIGLALIGACGCSLTGTGREAWHEDFDAVVVHLEKHYANLEWIAEQRRLDVAALTKETRARIDDAATHFGCASALEDYVEAFHDPHLRWETPWYSPLALSVRGFTWSDVWSDVGPEVGADAALDAFSIDPESFDFELEFDDVPGFEELPRVEGQPFPAGLLPLADGRKAGVLRIASFGWREYGACAREAWERIRADVASGSRPSAPIDDYAFFVEVGNAILRRLRERIVELRERGVVALVVDLTGNGGGTDWVDPAARLCTAVKLSAPRAGLLRDARTVTRLDRSIAALRADLARGELSAPDRALVEQGLERLEAQRADARLPVDRRAMFETSMAPPASSLLASTESYTSGALAWLPSDSLRTSSVRTILFNPLQFEWQEGAWDGPLFVLVDERTASASEYFAALLRDNDAATIFGRPTMGAGGGYVDGGEPLRLLH